MPQPLTRIMLTTTPGLEDVAAAELAERARAAGLPERALAWPEAGVAGRVRVDIAATEDQLRPVALALRSIHHTLRHVEMGRLPAEAPLAYLDERIREHDWPEMGPSTPFRVTADRHGDHPFSSYDVQVAAGAALRAATGAPVDLRGYRANVCLDIVYDRYVIGLRWSDRPLGLRFERRFNRRVALKPPVAYALTRLAAGEDEPARILDPFCGTGTLLLESGSLYPQASLHGADISAECVEGAGTNLEAAGMRTRAHLDRFDARELGDRYAPASFDLIVTNPPYGRRMGRGIHFTRFYRVLLTAAAKVLRPGGRLGVLVGKRGAFNKALVQADGWTLRHVRVIDMNHVRAGLFVVEREP